MPKTAPVYEYVSGVELVGPLPEQLTYRIGDALPVDLGEHLFKKGRAQRVEVTA